MNAKELTIWNSLTRENQYKVRHWKTEHENEYRNFKAAMMHAVYGDYSMYERIFKLFAGCIPDSVKTEIARLFAGKEYHYSPTGGSGDEIKSIIEHDGYFQIPVACLKDTRNDIDILLVDEQQEDDNEHLYLKATDTMDFWYSLPWDVICIIRSYTRGKKDEQRALAVRVIYMKISMSMPDIVESLNDLAEKNPIIRSALYFVIFDHGLNTSFRVVTQSLTKQSNIGNFKKVVDYALSLMAKTSISKGYDTKAKWEVATKDIFDDSHIDIIRDAIRQTKGMAGRPKTATNILRLGDILAGDLALLLCAIKEYRRSNSKPIDLAYLFLALRESGYLLTEHYSVFHHAMEDFEGRKCNIRYPQQMCTSFPLDEEILRKRGTRQQKLKKPIIDHWKQIFQKIRVHGPDAIDSSNDS